MNKVDALREAFFYFDNNHAGTIHIDELHDIVTRNGEAMPDVNEFLDEAAKFADGSGNVDYNALAQLIVVIRNGKTDTIASIGILKIEQSGKRCVQFSK